VYDNNVYYQHDPHATATQLTFTGDSKFIFNGVADWLYEGSFNLLNASIDWLIDLFID